MNFPEGVFEIEQGDDKRSLFSSSFVDGVSHFSCVFKSTGKFRKKAFLGSDVQCIYFLEESKHRISYVGYENFKWDAVFLLLA